MSPRTGLGRLVFDGGFLNRYENYLNRLSFLGGDTRLRGFPSEILAGKDIAVMNFEARSRPVEILSCQLGGVLFYDVGDAFNGWSNIVLKSSAGFGIRGLFPQLDRLVLRADVGFPISTGSADRTVGNPPVRVTPAFVLHKFPAGVPGRVRRRRRGERRRGSQCHRRGRARSMMPH